MLLTMADHAEMASASLRATIHPQAKAMGISGSIFRSELIKTRDGSSCPLDAKPM